MTWDENNNEIEDVKKEPDKSGVNSEMLTAEFPLKDKQRERFCQFVADGYSLKAAAFYAGYKEGGSNVLPNSSHERKGQILMREDAIKARVLILQRNKLETKDERVESITRVLEDIVFSDVGQYLASKNVQRKDGSVQTCYYLNTPIQSWDKRARSVLVNGLDSKGRPRFVDKQWAVEKLLQIYGVGNKGAETHIEDIDAAFRAAGVGDDTSVLNEMESKSDILIDQTINESNYYTEEQPRF